MMPAVPYAARRTLSQMMRKIRLLTAVLTLSLVVAPEVRAATFIVTSTGRFRPHSPHREISNNRGLGMPLMVALMDEVSFARAPGGCTTVSLSVLLDQNAAVPA